MVSTISFIGLGSIGLPIAANLMKAGVKLKVHTRSRKAEKDQRLKGTISCRSPKEVADGCDVLFVCVSDDNAVENILFGRNGALETLQKGSIIIDLSTISPSKSRSIAAEVFNRDVLYIDAPVTGGTEGAIAGKLTIFIGGNEGELSSIKYLLNYISENIYFFDEVGKGQEVKAMNQILVAGTYAAVAEAVAFGQSLDLPMDIVIEALGKGAASSWALLNRSFSMIKDIYPLGFKLSLHHKDLSIAFQSAKELNIDLPITLKVKEIEDQLIEQGFGSEDISVIRRSIITSFYCK